MFQLRVYWMLNYPYTRYIQNTRMGNHTHQQGHSQPPATTKTLLPQSQPYINLQPRRNCHCGNPIVFMCTNQQCEVEALYCERPGCELHESHAKCSSTKITTITALLQKRQYQQKQLIHQMHRIEQNTLQAYLNPRKPRFDKLFQSGFDQAYLPLIDQLYSSNNTPTIKGRLAGEFMWNLRESNSELISLENRLISYFERQVQKIIASLIKLEDSVIKQYTQEVKITQKIKKPQKKNQLSQLRLSILPECSMDHVRFISEALNDPKELKLIFRASQNDFLASRFHEVCDYTPHTLTLVRTEFNTIIGGYTPLTWNLAQQGIASDHTASSCLLLFDTMEKAIVQDPKQAIQCLKDYGPMFGGGRDLVIADQCNNNQFSCTNFPANYNKQTDPFKWGQRTWTRFCGAPAGKAFRVVQYEVYQVVW